VVAGRAEVADSPVRRSQRGDHKCEVYDRPSPSPIESLLRPFI